MRTCPMGPIGALYDVLWHCSFCALIHAEEARPVLDQGAGAVVIYCPLPP